MMRVQVVGCSYRGAPVELRERLAFTPEQTAAALDQFRTRFPQAEAVLLSTCNRVELYTACEEDTAAPSHEEVARFMASFHGLRFEEVFNELFESSGEEAIRHLFAVAASLESMVVGEPQILSQVKQAYALAADHQATGPLTNEIFQESLRVAKRVATETSINRKRVSVPSVAVCEVAREFFERFDDKHIVVIGAGEMAEETIRYLREEGAGRISIVNRSYQRAVALAGPWNGEPIAWDRLTDQLAAADMIVSTTASTEPIVRLEDFRRIEPERYQRPLLVLDLAIPRDFDPAIGDCLGVYLFSVDDLQKHCERNRAERDRELPLAMRIIDEETARFMAELNHRATGPIIKRLKQTWQSLKEDELVRLFRKLPDLSDRDRAEVNQAFDRLINKLLHPPLHSLRDESKRGSPQGLLEALRRLFHLKD